MSADELCPLEAPEAFTPGAFPIPARHQQAEPHDPSPRNLGPPLPHAPRKGTRMTHTTATADRFLTVAEVAQFLAVHEKTVYSYVAERGLPATRIGRTVRVRPSELAAWLAAQSD